MFNIYFKMELDFVACGLGNFLAAYFISSLGHKII